MRLLERLKAMFGRANGKTDNRSASSNVSPEVSRAIQRNEIASHNAQEALEHLKMSDTLRDIARKM